MLTDLLQTVYLFEPLHYVDMLLLGIADIWLDIRVHFQAVRGVGLQICVRWDRLSSTFSQSSRGVPTMSLR